MISLDKSISAGLWEHFEKMVAGTLTCKSDKALQKQFCGNVNTCGTDSLTTKKSLNVNTSLKVNSTNIR